MHLADCTGQPSTQHASMQGNLCSNVGHPQFSVICSLFSALLSFCMGRFNPYIPPLTKVYICFPPHLASAIWFSKVVSCEGLFTCTFDLQSMLHSVATNCLKLSLQLTLFSCFLKIPRQISMPRLIPWPTGVLKSILLSFHSYAEMSC